MRKLLAWGEGSGPLVARAFHFALALVFLDAFVSLGVQVDALIGSSGLLPVAPVIEGLRADAQRGFGTFPTLFWWGAGDAVIAGGIWLGVALSLAALVGPLARGSFVLLVPLYLSYTVACRNFLSFQWDNLLLECGLLAVLLPRDRPARWIHLLFRLVLFKLYFESGIAKWQSYLGDWRDGSAMTFYYETAPIPTWFAWYFHNLPAWWHHIESRIALVLELLVPLCIFGPRAARRLALVALSGFQILNLLTANYGFFCYLTLALHLFLLDDGDLARARAALAARMGRSGRPPGRTTPPPGRRPLAIPRRALVVTFVSLWLAVSVNEAIWTLTRTPGWRRATAELRGLYAPFRLVNSYHLFGHITRDRFEPEFQTLEGVKWTPHPMHFKPGPLDRAPPFVAPHQPRVDFRLWFYGLGFRRGTPAYVRMLMVRLCSAPDAVAELFVDPLPAAPEAVRILIYRYQFTSPGEAEGAYWKRTLAARGPSLRCSALPSPG